jgi:tRNA 2-thiouridine synthesizing protein E
MQTAQIQSRQDDDFRSGLFDEDGFLVDHDLWNEQLSRRIAEEEGVGELREAHWRVIELIRDEYIRLGAMPNMRQVCRATALSRTQIHNLFGGCLTIWRVAGLPNPGEEARTYLT